MKSMKKVMLIANPFSGKGQAKSALFDIVSCFATNNYAPTVFIPNDENRRITDLVREFAGEYDLVVCIGGDGTLSDTANGLIHIPNPPPVGYIPMGSTNDVASTLTLSKDPAEAAMRIINGTPTTMDMGSIGDKFFTYVAAFGAFTDVSYSTPQKIKNALGHAAYLFEAVSRLPEIKPVNTIVEYDDGVIEGSYVFGFVANSTSVAGLIKLSPNDVSLNDGLFEVMLVRTPLDVVDLGNIISNIVSKSYDPDKVVFLHTKNVKFTFSTPVAWTRDGENAGEFSELEIKNVHEALRLVL